MVTAIEGCAPGPAAAADKLSICFILLRCCRYPCQRKLIASDATRESRAVAGIQHTKKGPKRLAPALISLFVRRRNEVRRVEEGEERFPRPAKLFDQL
jgi:hypothetical protein